MTYAPSLPVAPRHMPRARGILWSKAAVECHAVLPLALATSPGLDEQEVTDTIDYIKRYGSLLDLHRAIREWAPGRFSEAAVRAHLMATGKAEHVREVRAFVTSLALFGRKSFRLYWPSPEARTSARALEGDGRDLRQIAIDLRPKNVTHTPSLYRVLHERDSTSLIFASKRLVKEYRELDRSWLVEDRRKELREEDRIRFVRSARVIAFDVVEIPLDPKMPAVMRVADSLEGGHTDDDEWEVAAEVQRAFLTAVGSKDLTLNPVDLFDAIDSIYRDPTEGRIVEIGFMCSTDVQRHEKSRRQETQDLRTEQYHVDGKQNVNISPFRIAVRWDGTQSGAEIECQLFGTKRMLDASQDRLNRALVLNARTRADYQLAVERVWQHVAPPPADEAAAE